MAATRLWLGALACAAAWAHANDVCLFQTRAHKKKLHKKKKVHKGHMAQNRTMHGQSRFMPPGWFGGFSESESTYDSDGWGEEPSDPETAAKDGWDTGNLAGARATPGGEMLHGPDIPAEWFEESRSGGPKEAWQTHYPALERGEGGGPAPPFVRSSNGGWHQHYQPSGLLPRATQSKAKAADWFDTDVDEYDTFGRRLEPGFLSDAAAIDWTSVTKSSLCQCLAPGCTCYSKIAMWEPETMWGKNCRFSFKVHVSDFDDDFSNETVEYVKVNDATVNTLCNPGAQGCWKEQQIPMYPCVTDMDMTQIIMQNNGTLEISAKISHMVDECPVDGYMLNAKATCTCYIARKLVPPVAASHQQIGLPPRSATSKFNSACPLRCAKPGCVASCMINLDPNTIFGKTCRMTIVANNTDFDGELGSEERIEWFKIDGSYLAADATPGKNPCKSEASGHPLPKEFMSYTPMVDQNVHEFAKDGVMLVEAKISSMVDECPSEGYLLNARTYVTCT